MTNNVSSICVSGDFGTYLVDVKNLKIDIERENKIEYIGRSRKPKENSVQYDRCITREPAKITITGEIYSKSEDSDNCCVGYQNCEFGERCAIENVSSGIGYISQSYK